jgi:hypothetical protein
VTVPAALVRVFADHGSFGVSLLFLGPVAVVLLALVGLTLRERRRSDRGDG